MNDQEEPVVERAAKGAITGWIAAKSWPWLIRLGLWALSLAALVAYGGIAWWRARRAVLAGALDDEGVEPGPAPSVVARDQGVLAWVKGATVTPGS